MEKIAWKIVAKVENIDSSKKIKTFDFNYTTRPNSHVGFNFNDNDYILEIQPPRSMRMDKANRKDKLLVMGTIRVVQMGEATWVMSGVPNSRASF